MGRKRVAVAALLVTCVASEMRTERTKAMTQGSRLDNDNRLLLTHSDRPDFWKRQMTEGF